MRRIVALIASCVLLAWVAPVWSQNPALVAVWVDQLVKPEQEKRIDAARWLVQLPSLPDSALAPITDYLQLEASEAGKQSASRGESISIVGDEVSLAKIEANLLSYLDRPFVLSGWLTLRPGTVANGYAYQFANAKNTHLLFDLHLAGLDGRKSLEQVKVFIPRCVGSVLSSQQNIRVRLKCLIQSTNIERYLAATFQNRLMNSSRIDSVERAWQALLGHQFKPCVLGGVEAVDWQVLTPDGEKWKRWSLGGIYGGYLLLAKVAKPSRPSALDLVTDEAVPQDTRADALLRESAILFLMGSPAKDRKLAIRVISSRAKRITSPLAKKWAERAYNSLMNGRLVE